MRRSLTTRSWTVASMPCSWSKRLCQRRPLGVPSWSEQTLPCLNSICSTASATCPLRVDTCGSYEWELAALALMSLCGCCAGGRCGQEEAESEAKERLEPRLWRRSVGIAAFCRTGVFSYTKTEFFCLGTFDLYIAFCSNKNVFFPLCLKHHWSQCRESTLIQTRMRACVVSVCRVCPLLR